MARRNRSAGARPRLQDQSAEFVKVVAQGDVGNMDSVLHMVKYAIQNREWSKIEGYWRSLEAFTAEASVAVSELTRRAKTLPHRKPRGSA